MQGSDSRSGVCITCIDTNATLDSYHSVIYSGLFLALSGPNIEGFRRRFSLDDQTIQYPYTLHERVPNWLLVVLAFVVPLLLMPVINLLTIRSLWDLHNSTLGLILSLALTGSLTNILKLTTGRPRPDLLARCLPTAGSQNPPVFGLVDSSICTQTSTKIMNDGWASFISGHSSRTCLTCYHGLSLTVT